MTLRNLAFGGILLNVAKFFLAVSLAAPLVSVAQTNLTIYADSLVNGWQDWSYSCTRNFANTSPVHSGSDSISVTVTSAWGGIQLGHVEMTNSAYAFLSFWLNGGPTGGQLLQMYGNLDVGGTNTAQGARYYLNTPLANTWQQYTVPLAALGVANTTNFTGFAIQDAAGSAEPTFYLDDIQLVSAVAPALTHLTVNASQPIRTADARWFGMNAAQWDGAFDTPQTITELNNMGTRALRFPGGSDSDDYHWVFNRQDADNWTWATSLANFIPVITNINGQAMITLNYGTGFTNEAAAWVAYVNASAAKHAVLGCGCHGHQLAHGGILGHIAFGRPTRERTTVETSSASRGRRRWVSSIGRSATRFMAPGKPTAIPCPMILTRMRCAPGIISR